MIMERFFFATFASICIFSGSLIANELEFFVNACRSSGHNPTLIQSGWAEVTKTARFHDSEDALRKVINERLDVWKDSFSAEKLEQMKESMFRMERDGTKSFERVLLKGNEQFQGLRRSETRQFVPSKDDPSIKVPAELPGIIFGVGNPNFPEKCEFLRWEPVSRTAFISNEFFGLPEFHRFGRMQGSFVHNAIRTLLDDTSRSKFVFPPKGIEKFKSFLTESGLEFSIAGEKEYDNGATATVLEVKKGDKVAERFWVDASKGYICPLIEGFDLEGDGVREIKSSNFFLHRESGLWFPTQHSDKTYAATTGETVHFFTYQIDPSTFTINQPVSDEEFCIDIPVDGKVKDNRGGKNRSYVADQPGTLSLAKGGLDLDRMSWLRTTDGEFLLQKNTNGRQYLFVAIGVALFALALYLRIRERMKKAS